MASKSILFSLQQGECVGSGTMVLGFMSYEGTSLALNYCRVFKRAVSRQEA